MKITSINHATVLIEIGGTTIITDPVYSMTVGFIIPRLKKPGIAFDHLPRIDIILISHNHHDHLNLRTLRRFRRKHASMVCLPKGLEHYARKTGYTDVVGMDRWEKYERYGVRITAVPAKHAGRRNLWEKSGSPYLGFVTESNGETVYFAGDTGYGEHFGEIKKRLAIDVALLPIGAYKPHEWFKNIHLNPRTAIQAFLDLGAKHLMPIHWGTFKISDEPMREPPTLLWKEALRLGIADRIHVVENGESFSFDRSR